MELERPVVTETVVLTLLAEAVCRGPYANECQELGAWVAQEVARRLARAGG